jgi:uncharacterized protein (DUF305 family)
MSMTRNIIATIVASLLVTAAAAQTMDHSKHAKGPMADYMMTMDTMMKSMDAMKTTGNADADFLIMMIPHHQSAIDMAQVELKQGKDEETRRMAQKIIDAQIQEIADMKAMLQRLGVKQPG